jgi:prepilin peptidase CpaA
VVAFAVFGLGLAAKGVFETVKSTWRWRGGCGMDRFAIIFLCTSLLTAVISDIRHQKIPNWLTITVLILAVSYNALVNGLSGFYFALEGACLGTVLLLIPYLMGGMGAGDAKLMGAIGGLLGPKGVFVAFLFTALIGGVYAIVIILLHGFVKHTLQRYGMMLKNFFLSGGLQYIPPAETEKKPKLRYGVAIALGTLLSVF